MDDFMPQANTAVRQVLLLPELVELILSFMPGLQLLSSQRTCKLWHEAISTSPLLQKALFMKADWTLEGRYADGKPGARPLNNLMLRQIMGGSCPSMRLCLLRFNSREEFEMVRKELDLSVSTKQTESEEHAMDVDRAQNSSLGLWAWNFNVSFPADQLIAAQARHPSIAYEKASWRRMLMSQPPATKLHLTKRWKRAAQPAVQVGSGITMQDLVDAATQSQTGWSEVYISSDRDWHLEGPISYSHFCEEQKKAVT